MALGKQFFVTVYKANSTFYQAGQKFPIYCNHQWLGNYGINTVGEIVPLPTSTVPGIGTAQIPHGTVFPNPQQFSDANFKAVVCIKDMITLDEYYVDAADYNTQIVNCFPVPYASSCPVASGLSAGTPGQTTATISWKNVASTEGVEYVNNTSSSAPTGDGTFVAVGTSSVSLTGLTASTTYHFWIRTICAGGSTAAWTSITYTTTA